MRCVLLIGLLLPVAALACVSTPAGEHAGWYRGNLHTHSLWSDGNDVPEVICDWYKANGYQFVALSDHNVLSDHEKWIDVDEIIRRGGRTCVGRYTRRFGQPWVETRDHDGKAQLRLKRLDEYRPLLEEPGEFLLIQSEEVTSEFERLPIHINVTNLQQVIPKQTGSSVREVMTKVLDLVERQSEATGRPMIAHLNHPNYEYAVTAEDLAAVVQERFFEVWNGHPVVHHRGDGDHAPVERLWDIANTLRIAKLGAPPLLGLATDDSHNYFNQDAATSISGRGWVMVRASELTAAALIAALQAGDFYASSGVTLARCECSEQAIDIEIRPVAGEQYVTEFIGTRVGYDDASRAVVDDDGEVMRATRRYSDGVGQVLARVSGTAARYELTGNEYYVRAVVISTGRPARPVFPDQRKKAWTQPVGWRGRLAR